MKKIIILILIALVVACYIISITRWYKSPYFRVIFFDVGQGDSALIITPRGQTILIDGGPDASVLQGLGQVLPFWLRHLDLVILTHVHDDHLAGLIEVFDRYQIKQVLIGYSNSKSPLIDIWQNKLAVSKSEIIKAKTGMIFSFDSNCNLKILAAEQKATDENDYSIVSLFSCFDRKILLTGDASTKIENNISFPPVDILKISHHGSNTGTNQSFLNKLKPDLAVISVGVNNKFGHPNQIVLNWLLTLPVEIFRTDELGSLYFLANNKSIIWKK